MGLGCMFYAISLFFVFWSQTLFFFFWRGGGCEVFSGLQLSQPDNARTHSAPKTPPWPEHLAVKAIWAPSWSFVVVTPIKKTVCSQKQNKGAVPFCTQIVRPLGKMYGDRWNAELHLHIPGSFCVTTMVEHMKGQASV